VDELGLDGYYVEAEGNARAALIEHLQLSGKLVCYVSGGGHDQAAMDSALLSVEVREASDLRETQAQIVLLDPRLRGLPGVFDLALAFADKQKFNLLNPVAVDFVDISTTVFLHFGLVYSVLLSYTGLLSSVVHARLPKNMPYAPGATAPPDFSAEASRQIA
jgi:Cu2+-exporting ATPase